MNIKRMIKVLVNLYRLIPAIFILIFQPRQTRELIQEDLSCWNRYSKINARGYYSTLLILLLEIREYRNLYIYRLSWGGLIIKLLFKPLESLYIFCPHIGPRLYIQHGFSTIICAQSIGSDCWINQQVTIGYTFDSKSPIIGNGVRVSAGAKVLGSIAVGDNSIIAANAAVVKDVPNNAIVGGVPAKAIGVNTDHKLYF